MPADGGDRSWKGEDVFDTGTAAEPWESGPYRFAATASTRLGVGVLYAPELAGFVRRNRGAVDFLSVIPEAFWPAENATPERSAAIADALRVLDAVAADRPLVAHGTGLAIGGAAPLDRRHLERIADWQARFDFRWFSEHLMADDDDGAARRLPHLVPIACDGRALARVAARVREVQALLPVPFLLENNFYATGVPQQEMSEPAFLNRLCAATGCGIVLDVDNLHHNAVDCGIDALSYLDRVDLTRVVEIHVSARQPAAAAGAFVATTLCPPPLLEVLEAVLWRSPRLRAVTIEVTDPATADCGDREILHAVEAARRVWKLYH